MRGTTFLHIILTSMSQTRTVGRYFDGNALFEWDDITLNPGDSVSFRIYYIFGDSKDEVLSGYDELEAPVPAPEFPTVALPAAMTVLGAALLIFKKREG